VLVAVWTFWDAMWSMVVFFLWIMWFWLLFTIWADIFRRDDLSGWGKTGWLLFTIVLPFLGAFVYLIGQNEGMTKRRFEHAAADRHRYDNQIREAAGGGDSAAQIAKAKQLLDSGTITPSEFEVLKQKALA
jgi:hypothetical protein